jgi:hypothetical protein
MRCDCTPAMHAALKDPLVWPLLLLRGHQSYNDGPRVVVLELRDCSRPGCGSTLALELPSCPK